MIRFLKKVWFNAAQRSAVPAFGEEDVQAFLREVKNREEAKEIPLGRRIHQVEVSALQVRLDRDVTERYRITVCRGAERELSFTVFGKQGDYDILEKAMDRVVEYLQGRRRISDLPDDEVVKGFHYGNPG